MSIAAQKALDNEFDLDIRVSHVSSMPQEEYGYSANAGCTAICNDSSPTLLTTFLTLTLLTTTTTFYTKNCN